MKLYYSPGACSLSPHIVAHEAGIALETRKSRHQGQAHRERRATSGRSTRRATCRRWNSTTANVLTEGPAIVQYLADQKPDAQLAPANGTMAALSPAGNARLHQLRDPQELQPAVQGRHAGADAQPSARRICSGATASSRRCWRSRRGCSASTSPRPMPTVHGDALGGDVSSICRTFPALAGIPAARRRRAPRCRRRWRRKVGCRRRPRRNGNRRSGRRPSRPATTQIRWPVSSATPM